MAGAPYVRRADPGPRGSRVSDLILRAGELSGGKDVAQANRYSADAARQGDTARSIAGMVANVGNTVAQYAQDAPRRELVQLNLDQAKAQQATSKSLTRALDDSGGDLIKAITLLESQGQGAAAMTLRDKRREQLAQESAALLNTYKVRGEQFSEGNRLVAAALADPALYPKIVPRLKYVADSIEKGWGDMVPDHFDPKALAAFDSFTLTETERAARQKNLAESAERARAGVKTQNELEDWGRDYLAKYFTTLDPAQAKPEDFQGALQYMKNRGVGPTTLSLFGDDLPSAVAASQKLLAAKPAAAQPGDLADLIAGEEKRLGRPLSKAEKLKIEREKTDARDTTPNISAGDVAADMLTPEALENAAYGFAMTGALPAIGAGKNAAAAKAKIMNRAAEMFGALDGPAQKAAIEANTASYKKRIEQLSALTAFEDTAQKNLDRFLYLAKQIPDLGAPWVNGPVRSISRKILGSPDMASFATALTAVVPEFARIITNPNLTGVLSDSARTETATMLAGDYSVAQLIAAAEELKRDAKNRKGSLTDEADAIMKRLSAPPKTRGSAAAPPPEVLEVFKTLTPAPVEGEEVELSDGSVWVITNGTPVKKGGK